MPHDSRSCFPIRACPTFRNRTVPVFADQHVPNHVGKRKPPQSRETEARAHSRLYPRLPFVRSDIICSSRIPPTHLNIVHSRFFTHISIPSLSNMSIPIATYLLKRIHQLGITHVQGSTSCGNRLTCRCPWRYESAVSGLH